MICSEQSVLAKFASASRAIAPFLVVAWVILGGFVGSAVAQDATRYEKLRRERIPREFLIDRSSVESTRGPAGLRRFRWDFSRASDKDFGGWPDNWLRYDGPGYPNYVGIQIQARDPDLEEVVLPLDTAALKPWRKLRQFYPELPPLPPSLADILVDRCLSVRLDGGLARVESPSLPANPTFQYQFSVDVRTQGLMHDHVYAQIVFEDAEGNELGVRETEHLTGNKDWTTLVLQDLLPPRRSDRMYVRLMVAGGEDGLEDITGKVGFDNVMFRQYPQLKIATDKPLGVYLPDETVVVQSEMLGLSNEHTRLRLRLYDHHNKTLGTFTRAIDPVEEAARLLAEEQERKEAAGISEPDDVVEKTSSLNVVGVSPRKKIAGLDDSSSLHYRWDLNDLRPGFYRVAASMENDRGASLANETSFIVLGKITNDPSEFGDPNETKESILGLPSLATFQSESDVIDPTPFGWTLPTSIMERHRKGRLHERELAKWMQLIGIGWAKLPVWFGPDQPDHADAAALLGFRLRDRGIQPIGLLDQPPEERFHAYQLRDKADTRVASLLRDESAWRPELEPLMNRMTMRIRLWQLGADDDHSFMGQSNIESTLEAISTGLQGFGQPIQTMIAWSWVDTPPATAGDSWRGLHRYSKSPLTAAEMDAMLDREIKDREEAVLAGRLAAARPPETWLTINPVSRKKYDQDSRITDLMLRMAATRGHDVAAAFLSDPMNEEAAVLTKDGRPDELLLPFRTASILLGHRTNAGSLRMQNGSDNIIFRGDKESVIMVWANAPTLEHMYLGENVYEVDVWGRRMPLKLIEHEGRRVQEIAVGRVPKFLVGIDQSLADFRMSVRLDRTRIDALLGLQQSLGVQFRNPINQSLTGEMAIVPPDSWRLDEATKPWNLLPKESTEVEFGVTLENNATIGAYQLPLDFRFETMPPTVIRVHRTISIGPEGFDIRVTTRLIDDGQDGRLRVKIEMVNHTNRLTNFDCLLFAGRDRQYERRVLVLPPRDTVSRNIDWPNGKELLGTRMWLRAIEQDGNRVINHSFDAKP
ncbi:hypothetical protein [Rhodopirellula bahusiensis]|uniref:hypothetical protein n=1 Tax=Rhodopirellula bahusiensis TaxID=2014065 RepID=UPI0036F1F55D